MVSVGAVVVMAFNAGSCSLEGDLAIFDLKMFRTPLELAIGEWKERHAAVLRVTPGEVERRWVQGRGLLDTHAAKDHWFDLSTDFCSKSPDTGRSYDFKAACVRHDFGYRNLKRLDLHWNCVGATANRACGWGGLPVGTIGAHYNRANRLAVNAQFRRDMDAHCETRPMHQRAECHRAAALYHAVVDIAAKVGER